MTPNWRSLSHQRSKTQEYPVMARARIRSHPHLLHAGGQQDGGNPGSTWESGHPKNPRYSRMIPTALRENSCPRCATWVLATALIVVVGLAAQVQTAPVTEPRGQEDAAAP